MVNCDMSEVRTSSAAKCPDNRFGNGGKSKMLSGPLEEYHSPTYSTLLP